MQDKPTYFPTTQPDGTPLKPVIQVLLDRRATSGQTVWCPAEKLERPSPTQRSQFPDLGSTT
jgi:hypothetical protein